MMSHLLSKSGEPIVHLLEVGEQVQWKHPWGNTLQGVVKKKPRGFCVETPTHIWHLARRDNGAWEVTIGHRIVGETKC
jgi:hypothetical protein